MTQFQEGPADRNSLDPPSDRQTQAMPLVVRILVHSQSERRRLTEHLRANGFCVDTGDLPHAAMLATVRGEIELTTRQRELVHALVTCETPSEIARALGVELKSARESVRSLAKRLGVESRHRLIVRLLEYGLLRVQPVPAPGAPDPTLALQVRTLVLRVAAPDPGSHDRLTTLLRHAGENVLDGVVRPYVVHLTEGLAYLPFTLRERDTLRALLTHDHTGAMADELGVQEHVVRDYLGHIYTTLGVHSRDRLLVRLLADGYLTVKPSPLSSIDLSRLRRRT